MRTITKLDIRKCARLAKPPKWLRVGVLLLAFGAPFALAGPEQDSELAVKEFARGDLVTAIALWRKAANEGYAPAQVWLGDILDKAEEDQEAVEWYRKAAAQGSPAGEYGLGQMYAKGEGVKKDFAEAQTHILRAAQKNYLPAVTLMMNAYRAGTFGLTRDLAQADAWEAKLVELSPGYKKATVSNQEKTKK